MDQTDGFDQKLLEIYGELSLDRLMELVVGYARDRLGAGGSSLFLRDDITSRYVLRSTTGLLEKMPAERIEYEPGEGLTGWMAKYGRPLRITNVTDSQELRRIADRMITLGKKGDPFPPCSGKQRLFKEFLHVEQQLDLSRLLAIEVAGQGEAPIAVCDDYRTGIVIPIGPFDRKIDLEIPVVPEKAIEEL